MENKKTNKMLLTVGFIILFLCWLEVLIFWNKIPPQIPWFYSLPWGELQLMNKSGLIWTLAAATLLSFGTSFIATFAKKGDSVIEKTVFITLTLANLLLFLNLSKVLMIFIA